MRKREQGILTVEASIVLTLMTLFVLFLFSFIRVYRAENVVSHATLQAADAMALESYLRENAMDDQADDVVYLANRLTGSTTLSAANFESLRSANVPTLAKEKFIAAVSNSESNANALLEIYGVKDGLSGIDFSSSTIDLDNDDVIVSVSYTLKMQFPIFGGTELSVTKTAKAKTFGEILFEIIAEPEDLNMGSTSGSGNYQHGSTIQITANPNYGYKFVKWDDGNTDNPRIVPVTEAHKYIAIFEADSFGINTVIAPADAGSATGAGTYTYLSIANLNATANPGYHFEKWSVYKHNDSTTTFVTTPDVSQTVDQSYTYTANFVPNTYTIKVKAASSGAAGTVTVKSGASSGESVNVTYGSSFDLIQTPPTGYVFKGWKVEGGTAYISPASGISVPNKYPNGSVIPNNATITYTAYYEIAKYNVSVTSAGNGSVSGGGAYTHGSNATIVATPSSGYEFDYWEKDGIKVNIGSSYSFPVTSIASYKAHFKKMIDPSVSVSIIGGGAGDHSVKLKATTIPPTTGVTWTANSKAVKITVDPTDSHIATVTVQDNDIASLKLDNNGSRSVDAKITASITYGDKTCSDSKTLTITPSITMEYYCRRDGFCSYSNSKCGYGPSWWTKNGKRRKNTLSPLVAMRFYYDSDPGPNDMDSKYGKGTGASIGVFHKKIYVTWSQLQSATTVAYKKQLTKSMIKHDTATSGPYAGVPNPQVGYNAVNKNAYIFYDGVYDALWFVTAKNAPKDPSNLSKGYYDYYINAIK